MIAVPRQQSGVAHCLGSTGLVLSSTGAATIDDANRLIPNEARTGKCIVVNNEWLRLR